MAQAPFKFVCPQCGLDSSEFVNELIRREIAEQNIPPMPPPPTTPVEPPKPAPARLKISHQEKPPAEVAPTAEAGVSKYCSKHHHVLTTENCTVCQKPICPQCLELFGYFCSPLCKNKADLSGVVAPTYAGGRFEKENQFWRKTGLIFGAIVAAVVLFFGVWIWYAWFGSVPHTYFSVRFAEDERAYAGAAQLVGADQIVFLHGGTLARYDLKTGKPAWSQELVTPAQIDAIVKAENDARARDITQNGNDVYARTQLPSAQARLAKIGLQNALTLSVSNQDIWVASPGKLTQYDWNSGKVLQEVTAVDFGVSVGNDAASGGLFSHDGKPLDPDKVVAQAQNLNLPARIALPALLGNDVYEQKLEAALRDDDTHHPPSQKANASARAAEHFTLIAGENDSAQFGVKLLQQNIVTREAMRAAPKKSALDNPNLNASQTTDVANDILNEMQRNHGGDTVSEDQSRYQVTVHIPNAPGVVDWTGEVVGPPQLFCLKTVNVIAAGKSITVLDKENKKLWAAR